MGTANEYIVQGFYPDDMELRMEITTYDDRDAMAVAQGLLKVTTLRSCFVIDAADGRKIFEVHQPNHHSGRSWTSTL